MHEFFAHLGTMICKLMKYFQSKNITFNVFVAANENRGLKEISEENLEGSIQMIKIKVEIMQ